jgi:hypothetical protein
MMPVRRGALAAAQEQDPTSPDGSPEHEQAESPDFEQQERQQGDDDSNEGPEDEAPGSPEDQAEEGQEEGQQPGDPKDPQAQQLFQLAVSRVLEALGKDGRGLDAAMKADPIRASVQYGTAAVRTVAQSAQDAGKPIPFDILIQVGMQTVKELAAVALQKSYIQESQVEVFLKEVFQQSLAKYAQSDIQDGSITPQMAQQVSQKLGTAGAAAMGGAAPTQPGARAGALTTPPGG